MSIRNDHRKSQSNETLYILLMLRSSNETHKIVCIATPGGGKFGSTGKRTTKEGEGGEEVNLLPMQTGGEESGTQWSKLQSQVLSS